MSFLKDLRDLLSGWPATIALLCIYTVVLAGATWIEAALGAESARMAVYHAWWTFLLGGLLITNFVLLAHRTRLWKRRRWGVLLLHGGLVVILLAAMTTHCWSYEGTMNLREGESSNRLVVTHTDRRPLPFSITLCDFRLVRYPGSNTPSSYESNITIHEGATSRDEIILMNHIARVGAYRLYQASYDPDEQGTTLSVNYDPVGTPLTYFGYTLLIAGLVAAICQRGSRVRLLLASLDAASDTGEPQA